MFTGIVEEIGVIRQIRRGAHSSVLTIGADTVLSDLKIGDSVAVNGVCLTATSWAATRFTADVMHETLRRSSLGSLAPGSRVNLERAMAANGRFGGHRLRPHRRHRPHRLHPPGRQRRLVHRGDSGTASALYCGKRLHHHRRHQFNGGHRGAGPVLRLGDPPPPR